MNSELTVRTDEMSLSDLGITLAKSGFFQDSKDASQAIVKVLAGREIGIGPIASMTGIYIVNGKPSFGANVIAAAIKRSGKYDYRVIKLQDDTCELAFFQDKTEIGRSVFTAADAKRAQTKNMDKFPKNMLFARAISNGARWYCPDIFNGTTPYTPEELGAEVNQDGDVIDVVAKPVVEKKQERETPRKNTKGANELDVLNGYLGMKTPKGTSFSEMTPEQLKTVSEKLNGQYKLAAEYLLKPASSDLWTEYAAVGDKLTKAGQEVADLPETTSHIVVWQTLGLMRSKLDELEQGIPEEFK